METDPFTERKYAVMQSKQGKTLSEIAESLNRSIGWVSKWLKRYREEGWRGLKDRPKKPKRNPRQTPKAVKQAICNTRLELEARAALGHGLKYIGARAIRTELQKQGIRPLPSVPTIERVLRSAGLTKPKEVVVAKEIKYPTLAPKEPHQLIQVDIVPHFLQGGERVACFNALDVVSRYATGNAFLQRTAPTAVEFLWQVWQEIGIPQYTQVDNEGCFSGGGTHPYVLGKAVRAALQVGTELLFSPPGHPKSNGYVERFHQEYDRHVWQDTYLSDLTAVNQCARNFFDNYAHWQGHRALDGVTPVTYHQQQPPLLLPDSMAVPSGKSPLYEGRIHFMRQVRPNGSVSVLNVSWPLPDTPPETTVWVTVELTTSGAQLFIYSDAPDASTRDCLAIYPFRLNEPVLPRPSLRSGMTTTTATNTNPQAVTDESFSQSHEELALATTPAPPLPDSIEMLRQISTPREAVKVGERVLVNTLSRTVRLTRRLFFTMS